MPTMLLNPAAKPAKYVSILAAFQKAFDGVPGGLSAVYQVVADGGDHLVFRSGTTNKSILDKQQYDFLGNSDNKEALKDKLEELEASSSPLGVAKNSDAEAFDTWKFGASAATAVCRPTYLSGSSFAAAAALAGSAVVATQASFASAVVASAALDAAKTATAKISVQAHAVVSAANQLLELATTEATIASAAAAVAAKLAMHAPLMMFESGKSKRKYKGKDVSTIIPTHVPADIVMFSDDKKPDAIKAEKKKYLAHKPTQEQKDDMDRVDDVVS